MRLRTLSHCFAPTVKSGGRQGTGHPAFGEANPAALHPPGTIVMVTTTSRRDGSSDQQAAVVDLFSGAGGISEGLRQAGFDVLAGVDLDASAVETYRHNFASAHAVHADLSITTPSILGSTPRRETIVLAGGPPCQGFSIAGHRLIDDPRNYLYRAYFRFIRHLEPSAVLIENVPNLRSLGGGRVLEEMISDLEAEGYRTTHKILNAADYGVPQARKRLFIVGLKNHRDFNFPEPTTSERHLTVEEAISDLPSLEGDDGTGTSFYTSEALTEFQALMRDGCGVLTNHWSVQHTSRTKEIIALVPDGGNYKTLPKHLQNTRRVNIAWTRMASWKPSHTIDAGHNHHFHYRYNRVPSVRECARIQTFPDRFQFLGNKTSQFRQVGNAVPVLLARAIGSVLREQI